MDLFDMIWITNKSNNIYTVTKQLAVEETIYLANDGYKTKYVLTIGF